MARVLNPPARSRDLVMKESPAASNQKRIFSFYDGQELAILMLLWQHDSSLFFFHCCLGQIMSSPSGSFDHVDRALLEVLQRDGRATVGQLAVSIHDTSPLSTVGAAAMACWASSS